MIDIEGGAAPAGVCFAAAPETGGAGPGAGGEAASAPAANQKLDPEVLAKISQMRARLHETFGKVVLAMLTVPRYRNLPLGELSALVLDPLMRDRIALATATKEGDPADGTLSGIAIWASVSAEADQRIREQIRAGTFPVRLKPEDWTSGKINWLLDIIAPNPRLTTRVIANFRQVVKEGDMRIHPILTRLIEPEALKKMGAQPIKSEG